MRKLISLFLNVSLLVQTTLLPMAQARREQRYGGEQTRDARGAAIASGVLQTTQQLTQGVQQMMQQFQAQQAYQQMMQQMQGFHPRPLDATQIPGVLAQAGCQVLPAQTQRPGGALSCETEITDPMMAQSYAAMMQTAFQISNTYEIFATDGNAKGGPSLDPNSTAQGMACYNRALSNFDARLRARVERLQQLKNALEANIAQFEEQAQADLDAIRYGEALLTGEPADQLNGYRFADQVSSDQCRSFLDLAQVEQAAGRGLEGVQQLLTDNVSGGKGTTLSPSQMISKAGDMEREINQLAQQLSNNLDGVNLQDIESALGPALGTLNSRTGIHNSEAFSGVIQRAAAGFQQQMGQIQEDIGALGINNQNLSTISEQIMNPRFNFEGSIDEFERTALNSCLNQRLNSNDLGNIGQRLEDPALSRQANRNGDNPLANYISSILADNTLSIEEKLAKIQAKEREDGNERFTFNLGTTTNFNGTEIQASDRLRASTMIGLFARNCRQVFEENNEGTGFSQRDQINRLRELRTQYQAQSQQFRSELAGDIIRDLTNCPGDTSTGVGHNTCSSDNLNTQSGNFCIRTAQKCAANMNSCYNETRKLVDEVRATQQNHVDRYQRNLEGLKANMRQEFMAVSQFMEAEARELDMIHEGQGTLYNVPMELNFSTLAEGGDLHLREPAGLSRHELDDPRAYLERINQNLDQLIAQTQDHNNQIMNGGASSNNIGLNQIVENYRNNYSQMQGEWEGIYNQCMSALQNFERQQREQIAQANQAQEEADNEYNESLASECRSLTAYNQRPSCSNLDNLLDVVNSSEILGANTAGQVNADYERYCEDDGDNGVTLTPVGEEESAGGISATELCAEGSPFYGNGEDALIEVNRLCDRIESLQRQLGVRDTCTGDFQDKRYCIVDGEPKEYVGNHQQLETNRNNAQNALNEALELQTNLNRELSDGELSDGELSRESIDNLCGFLQKNCEEDEDEDEDDENSRPDDQELLAQLKSVIEERRQALTIAENAINEEQDNCSDNETIRDEPEAFGDLDNDEKFYLYEENGCIPTSLASEIDNPDLQVLLDRREVIANQITRQNNVNEDNLGPIADPACNAVANGNTRGMGILNTTRDIASDAIDIIGSQRN